MPTYNVGNSGSIAIYSPTEAIGFYNQPATGGDSISATELALVLQDLVGDSSARQWYVTAGLTVEEYDANVAGNATDPTGQGDPTVPPPILDPDSRDPAPLNPQPIDPDSPDFTREPSLFRNIYERQLNIAPVGRTRYQQWLAQQFEPTTTQYLLEQEGLGSVGAGGVDFEPRSYAEYLNARGNTPAVLGSSYLGEIGRLGVDERQELLDRLPNFAQPEIFYGAQRGRVATAAARGLTRQAFSEPSQRRFEISPFAQQARGGTYLEYLRQRFGL